MIRRHALLAFLSLALAACDTSDDGKLPLSQFECDAGEAAIRHLISKLPDLNPGIAKSHSIVLGEINRDGMTPATEAFTARFADLKLKFVDAAKLKVIEPDFTTADPDTRLAAFVLQLRTLQQTSATTWAAEVGWSYKKEFGRLKLRLEIKDGKTTVIEETKIETK